MLPYLQSNREEEVRMINVAIIGFGVVGSGVYEIITKNSAVLKRNTGEDIRVKRVLDIRDFSEHEQKEIFTKSFEDILEDEEISVVAETMGGVRFAYEYTKALLESGKNVVTSNKELVAKHGDEFFEIAEKNNVRYLYEASVGGGIPIIRPISRCLAGNRIDSIAGILNGTTNFIMTKMIMERTGFSDALSLAQKLGYAEKDPTADVEGLDACRKICILSSLAFGRHVYPNEVHTEGISKITLDDVEDAERFGYVIKLIAQAKKLENGKIYALVSPALVKKESMLAGVSDVFNACLVRGDMTGDILLYGKGAGASATASAVVGDIIDCADNREKRKVFGWKESVPGLIEDYRKVPVSLFVRIEGSKAEKEKVLSLLNPEKIFEKTEKNELSFITRTEPEEELQKKLSLGGFKVLSSIRVTDY